MNGIFVNDLIRFVSDGCVGLSCCDIEGAFRKLKSPKIGEVESFGPSSNK